MQPNAPPPGGHAGARPNARVARREAASANPRTLPSTATLSIRGRFPGRSRPRASVATTASPTPTRPETSARRKLSVRRSRAMRTRVPPSARRRAISSARARERASIRFMTLAQAMRSTRPTAPRPRRTCPSRRSCLSSSRPCSGSCSPPSADGSGSATREGERLDPREQQAARRDPGGRGRRSHREVRGDPPEDPREGDAEVLLLGPAADGPDRPDRRGRAALPGRAGLGPVTRRRPARPRPAPDRPTRATSAR